VNNNTKRTGLKRVYYYQSPFIAIKATFVQMSFFTLANKTCVLTKSCYVAEN